MNKKLFIILLIICIANTFSLFAEEEQVTEQPTEQQITEQPAEQVDEKSAEQADEKSADNTTAEQTTKKTDEETADKQTNENPTVSKDNPFTKTEVKIKESVASSTLKVAIVDLDTAKAAGITEIKDGYPLEGTLGGLGSCYLRLRSWPWGNVIGQYYEGTKVSVLGESGEFYLVEVNGQQGYMHKNYVSTSTKAATGIDPYYPGDTKNGGALSLSDGVKSSNDAASGKVPTVTTDDGSNQTNTTETGGVETGNNGKIVLTVPKQCQHKVKCPAPGSACGPTSLAMAMAYYNGQNVSNLSTKMYTATGCTSSGSGYDGLMNAAKKNGFPNAKWNYNCTQSWVRQKIQNKTPLVAHVKGHFVVITGIDNNGNVVVNDPAWSSVERKMSWSEFSAWWQSKACLTLK